MCASLGGERVEGMETGQRALRPSDGSDFDLAVSLCKEERATQLQHAGGDANSYQSAIRVLPGVGAGGRKL